MNSEYWKDEIDNDVTPNEWYSVLTIQLGELVESGVFDWKRSILDWSEAAYDAEQYERICKYFVERFYFREISIEPFYEWAVMLKRKLVYEIMPKYRLLYDREAQGVNPLQDSAEYEKRRVINSDYPETLLSGNSDYLSAGTDSEYDRIHEGDMVDTRNRFADVFRPIDMMLCDELESMFVSMYSVNMNGF